jgi:putative transposase
MPAKTVFLGVTLFSPCKGSFTGRKKMDSNNSSASGRFGRVISLEKKLEILKACESQRVSDVAEKHDIESATIYGWQKKLAEGGQEALVDKRTLSHPGNKTVPDWKKEKVLTVKESDPGFGPSQIRNQLRREGITISLLSIRNILKQAGIEVGQRNEPKKDYTRFEASRPLELAQIDICEFYLHKLKVYLVLLLDDFSRFLLNFALLDECKMEAIEEMVSTAIDRYGKMERLLSDRGFVFHGWRGINAFERWLEEMDIYHIHTSPHHPETIGKIEAVNKSIQKELIRLHEFANVDDARQAISEWLWRYNYHRVHQGLDGLCVPADRFHGWLGEVDKSLSKMVENGIDLSNRDVSLFNIRLSGGKIHLTILGRQVYIAEKNTN